MQKFKLVGVVDRTVTDVISLTIEAEDHSEAFEKAREVLRKYPEKHEVQGVPFCYVDSREWDEPELLDLRYAVDEDEGIA